ncbi:MAG: glutaredoxin domain-containing protein [Aquabacterium sp.]|uniref:glutaredoxin domain-containing protein n=1 Tax=Aquabacterium sp. TaxID=1872578 RepID=UPI00271B6177|nr:glutaredoxin domain-containing protein [Aquabacterium sp.]MDO9003731.1 glutaredoxin domain-containing protein [Aquabacterium sp.]
MSRYLQSSSLLATAVGLALLSAGPAWALYKVVAPDGRVTYTDRPPTDRPAATLKTNGTVVQATGLPFELQRVVSQYPVTFYSSSKCVPCDGARQMLQGRGIPYVEKTVDTSEDILSLQKLEGLQQVPILKVGSKQLVGFAPADWGAYLDAAGYPAKSALPTSYKQAPATPLVPPDLRAPVPEPLRLQADTPTNVSPAPNPTPPPPPGFRF